jgi:hypothetical protein
VQSPRATGILSVFGSIALAGDGRADAMAGLTQEQLEALSLVAEFDSRHLPLTQKFMTESVSINVVLSLVREGFIVVRLEPVRVDHTPIMLPMVKITEAGRETVARSSGT